MTHRVHRVGAIVVGGLILAVMLMMTWGAPGASAFAAPGTAVNQCNGTFNGGGRAVACDVTVTNHLNRVTGKARSTVTVKACHGAANAGLTCTTSTDSSSRLTTSVTQCNGSASGGGGTITCTVHVVNTVVGKAKVTPATVNQCNGSGKGGGTQPTTACSPIGSTSGATITQCNGSGNGGGGSMRVKCTVTTSTVTPMVTVRINQCNGSANGGGATVTCSARISNRVVAAPAPAPSASPSPSPSRTATRSPAPVQSAPPSAAPPASAPAAAPPAGPPPGRLPMTGFAGESFTVPAVVVVLLGAAMLLIARRPRAGKDAGLHRR
jgi:hypothetical protein